MEDNEIIEGTKTICLFIGGEIKEAWRVQENIHFTWTGEKVNEWREIGGMPILKGKYEMSILLEHCKWHSDWNWLMPLVNIIRLMLDRDADNYKDMKGRWQPIANELQNCSIKHVWFCVVKFIEWYNQNK